MASSCNCKRHRGRQSVKVTDGERPVAGAEVKADVTYGMELRSRTDADGIARMRLLPSQKLWRLAAWTNDYRIAGFILNDELERDSATEEYALELVRCRDQKIRFVDEEDKPVPGITFDIRIAPLPPEHKFIGTNETSLLTTDSAGEAIYKWFPDWKNFNCRSEFESKLWTADGRFSMVDDVVVFKLKKSKSADRKRVTGRVVAGNTSSP